MRNLLTCCLFLACFCQAMSQTTTISFPKNEITVAYGVATIPEIAVTFGSLFASSITGQDVDDIRGGGALVLSCNYFPSRRFSWGFTGIYEKVTTVYKNPADEYDWTALTAMLNAKFYYVANPSFRLYSGIAAGYTNLKSKGTGNDSNDAFGFQINGIGARFGNRIGVLGEIGFGYEGVVKAGLSVKF